MFSVTSWTASASTLLLLLSPLLARPASALAAAESDFAIQAKQTDLVTAAAENDYSCSRTKPCELGCCKLDDTGTGVCGAGPDFCGADVCYSQCSWKSECDPGWGIQWSNASSCPLEVCCSDFGFCGTTADFCNGRVVSKPECSGRSSDARTIGYYEGWNAQRPCGTMPPKDIPLGYYTHIFYSFALIDPKSFHVAPMDAETASHYDEVTALKAKQSGLEVWIAIGGWAMNDPGPFRTAFSDMAASEANQDAFFDSLVTFLLQHNFDGVDLDWEYPVAEDRGGVEADFKNFSNMLRRLRAHLNRSGKRFGVSLTLPASYWYLRGFDIVNLEPHIDFFNVMTYDIHGTWDSTVRSMGPYAFAHTNLTEIDLGLELLWRNNINPERVNMGLGFYGRSFTMKDPSCMAAGCEFTEGARGGECTGTPGVLSAAEIVKILKRDDARMTLDEAAAVQIVTWDSDQWVSWDDQTTLKMKQDFANRRCLGGTMVWAIDLDDGTLIGELGANLNRPKAQVYNSTYMMADTATYTSGEEAEL
ncbi:chitinase [Colletotrichum tofieldiae]|uniref:chitinase n=1 Tax=Colletotrichum tofieldiae TaxID=708197 RepID=A0A161YM65_9PEZI|nr:chitinase [Colletotrichum tofieldiae]GKT64295.1 chitinase [Colletotrichum tofieldiae]GKT74269.1 chitinase [Colletotrichum tofieldiae]